MVGPSRASQICGPSGGVFGFWTYCQSHRRRLASAASWPNTRRYSASIARPSSKRKRSMSAMILARSPPGLRRRSGARTRWRRRPRPASAGCRAASARSAPASCRNVRVWWRSSRRISKPASRISERIRRIRTFSSRSSCLTASARAALMNVFSCSGSLSVHGACRASAQNVANAARRPMSRCSGTGTFRRGRCAPANDRYGAVDRYIRPPGFSTRPALAQVAGRVGHVLDHGVRQHEVERRGRETAATSRSPRRTTRSARRARRPASCPRP